MNDNNLDETVKRESKREREIHVSALPFLSTDFPLDGWRGLGAVHELIKRERVYEEGIEKLILNRIAMAKNSFKLSKSSGLKQLLELHGSIQNV
ncbi:unnamed protein product [Arabidopsis lyrata]|nr:unnamed protein product [Arabidopsis lyrata]